MAATQPSDSRFDLELALHGPDPRKTLPDLLAQLTAAGADRVVEERVGRPEPGKRAGGVLEVLTLTVGGVANVVAVVDTVYRWLAAHRSRGPELPPVPEEEQVPSVTISSNGLSVTLSYPADWVQKQAVDQFLREHGQERAEP